MQSLYRVCKLIIVTFHKTLQTINENSSFDLREGLALGIEGQPRRPLRSKHRGYPVQVAEDVFLVRENAAKDNGARSGAGFENTGARYGLLGRGREAEISVPL